MSFKKSGTKITKFALAAVTASSVVVAANPADAASQKNAEKLVQNAEKLAARLQKEVTYESRVKLYPKDKLGLPSTKLYKDTGLALKKAKKEVNKLKGSSKKLLQTRLSEKVEKPYNYATTYVKVVNNAKELDKTNKTLTRYLEKGKIYSSVIKLHTKYTKDIKNFSESISQVRGTETKKALRDTFVKKFNKTDKSISYAITIQKQFAQLDADLKAGNNNKALTLEETIQKRLAEGKKLGYIKGTLAKNYDASLKNAQQNIAKLYTYRANSSDVVNPTIYGGSSTKSTVVAHDLIIVAGKDQYIKVSNVEVNGNIIIKGNSTGAGTVILDNVKVNAVNGKGGEIIVEDVAEHSLYMKDVNAEKLNIKDINGAHIVAQEGNKIKALNITDKAGETGKINLVSTKGAFDQVAVASTGGTTGVVFNGDFSESNIEVKAPEAQIIFGKDAVIKAIDIKSESKINAQEGSKVEDINLAVGEKGQKVEFSGSLKDTKVTIANANVNIEVAKDTVIHEIVKDKDVTENVTITNSGKIDVATGVGVNNQNGGTVKTSPSSGGSSGGSSSGSSSRGSSSVIDQAAPTVVTLSPTDNATDVAPDANLSITFNEDIQAVTGKNITIYDAADNSVVATIDANDPQVTVNNKIVTINPTANLSPSKNYYIQVEAGAFTDISTNKNPFAGIMDKTTWNFGTTTKITTAGTYGPASGNQTIDGNVTIANEGVTLRNVTIKGNLILDKAIGEGDVRLEGVTVQGETIVNGGGEHSVYFKDSVLVTVIVNKNNGAVRIVAQGNTQVYEVQLETPAIVREDNLTNTATGFEDIVVSETMQSAATGYQVQLEGAFETINSRATNVRINLSQETDIRTLVLNAAAEVLGEGIIGTAEINADGSTLAQRPQNVVLDINGSVTIGEDEITDSYSDPNATSAINSIEANQGSITVDMENFIAELTATDFNVTALVDGQPYPLQNVVYHSNQKRFTFDPIPLTNNVGKTVEIKVESNSEKIVGDAKTDSFTINTGFSGRITDIQGVGIEGMKIKFRAGTGSKEGEVVGEATTDRYGYYSVNLPEGTYTGEMSGIGYITTYMLGVAPTDTFGTNQNETAIRAAASNEVKVMLSWGENPEDLDSHLTGPGADGTPFHIAYYNKEEIKDGITYVDLDWDDTDSYGPETTTIRKLVDGNYRFYIHNFSETNSLRLSGAKVEVFKGNGVIPINTFNVPTGDGQELYWVVYDMKVSNQGETVEIVPVDIMVNQEQPRMKINGEETTGGVVAQGTKVELVTDSPGTKLHYTTDGSEPTLDSPVYTEAIEINENTPISVLAVNEGVIVGMTYGEFIVGGLVKATENLEVLENLVNDGNPETTELDTYDKVDSAYIAYQRAKVSIETLITDGDTPQVTLEEKTALLNRLEAAKAALDVAATNIQTDAEKVAVAEEIIYQFTAWDSDVATTVSNMNTEISMVELPEGVTAVATEGTGDNEGLVVITISSGNETETMLIGPPLEQTNAETEAANLTGVTVEVASDATEENVLDVLSAEAQKLVAEGYTVTASEYVAAVKDDPATTEIDEAKAATVKFTVVNGTNSEDTFTTEAEVTVNMAAITDAETEAGNITDVTVEVATDATEQNVLDMLSSEAQKLVAEGYTVTASEYVAAVKDDPATTEDEAKVATAKFTVVNDANPEDTFTTEAKVTVNMAAVTVTGTLTVNPTTVPEGEAVTISLADADLNTDSLQAEEIVVSDGTKDITLTETGLDTGIFTSTNYSVEFGTGSTVTITYNDSVNNVGEAETIKAIITKQ